MGVKYIFLYPFGNFICRVKRLKYLTHYSLQASISPLMFAHYH